MITHQALIGQDKPGSGQEPTNIPRRALLGGAGALVALLASPVSVMAEAPDSPFVILLKGLYEPVVQAPNLGLSVVDLSDGSYSKTQIYPISGIPGSTNPDKTIGDFYGQPTTGGDLCAYHVPGGSFAMRFTGSDVHFVPDGFGGQFLVGTFELTILEGTGIYESFVGGHNHMVDNLHFLAPGDGSGGIDEFCFCNITRP
jgi:hypothetical protein